jgi:ABC-type glutathione transport system ATPase component
VAEPILRVRDLDVGYAVDGGVIRAVRGASFDVHPGEILGLVGESGSGKSTLTGGMLRLLAPPAVILGGDVQLAGIDVLDLDNEGLRRIRWKTASLVPQSALNALNPILTIGRQFADTLAAHGVHDARARAAQLFQLVDLDPTTWTATPTSCPAACDSAWPWPWPWPSTLRSS